MHTEWREKWRTHRIFSLSRKWPRSCVFKDTRRQRSQWKGSGDTAVDYLLLKKHKNAQAVPEAGPAVPARRRAAPVRTGAGRNAWRYPRLLVRRDRAHALYSQQWNHRGIPQQNGDHQPSGVRVPQLRELPSARSGDVCLLFLGSGLPPFLAYSPPFLAYSPSN